ncbi:MAG: zinc ribbon domain-containing protein, partial [Lachnospiraceae bacterium]|nr:zinc ribbon domain-containing protein [Lachnospiraceae bacterium]
MKCNKCGKENRQEAIYCRFCGEEISSNLEVEQKVSNPSEEIKQSDSTKEESSEIVQKQIDGFLGHEAIREDLNKYINKRRIEKKREQSGFEADLTNHIILFSG